jgi:hypothetical protein
MANDGNTHSGKVTGNLRRQNVRAVLATSSLRAEKSRASRVWRVGRINPVLQKPKQILKATLWARSNLVGLTPMFSKQIRGGLCNAINANPR